MELWDSRTLHYLFLLKEVVGSGVCRHIGNCVKAGGTKWIQATTSCVLAACYITNFKKRSFRSVLLLYFEAGYFFSLSSSKLLLVLRWLVFESITFILRFGVERHCSTLFLNRSY
jgi:hypothetical protein